MDRRLKFRLVVDFALFFVLFGVWLVFSLFVIQRMQFVNVAENFVSTNYYIAKVFVQFLGYTVFAYPLIDFLSYWRGLKDGSKQR